MVEHSKTVALVLVALAAVASFGGAGCAHREYFPGTTILKTEQNREVIEVIEQYRRRLIERNIEGMLVLASDKYFEDSGTPRSDDDYGYEGLKEVLMRKLQRVKSLRFDIEYNSVKIAGSRAEIEVFLDGSFELAAESGDRYRRVNDYHRFVLDRSGERWKFLSGM